MAHKKAGGSAGKNRDSISKRLGIKRYGGELVHPGNILVRQKGSHFYPGDGTKQGNDYTIYSLVEGKVEYLRRKGKNLVQVNG